MRCKLKGDFVFIAVAVLVIGLSVWYVCCSGPEAPKAERERTIRSRQVQRASSKSADKVRSSKRVRTQGEARIGAAARGAKPVIVDFEAEEEAKLTEQHRQLLKDIRAALDADDKKTMTALIQKMQKLEEWPDGIPSILKKTAIEAMAWFGADCLPELVGFFADKDAEVISDVISQYEDALSNPELTAEQIAQLLVVASQYVHDADAMDSMLTSFNELPHSLAVSTIKTIMEVGTAETKQVLPGNIDFYTGEENLHTPEALDEWLEKHPDEHDDQIIE